MPCEVTLMYCSKFETKNFNSFGTHIFDQLLFDTRQNFQVQNLNNLTDYI